MGSTGGLGAGADVAMSLFSGPHRLGLTEAFAFAGRPFSL